VFSIISCYDGRGGSSQSEAHVALLTAQLRYHQEIVWLQRRRQQRQQKEGRRSTMMSRMAWSAQALTVWSI